VARNVPFALAKNRDIDEISRVADEIQDDDPSVSRICIFVSSYFISLVFLLI